MWNGTYFLQSAHPSCDLFQCCQSQTDDNDEGRKDCLVLDEARLMYETCINDGNTTESSCICERATRSVSLGNRTTTV
jgi:hypothetical protein